MYYLLPSKCRSGVLLLTSYLFYGLYNLAVVPFLALFTCAVYGTGLLVERRKTKMIVGFGIVLLLLPLLICKYLDFGLDMLIHAFRFLKDSVFDRQFNLIQPLGISYFTFKSVGYLVDVYRGTCKAERNLIDLAAFVSFFPEILIGPIDRANNLLRQIKTVHPTPAWENIKMGFLMLLGGYFEKMVVADRLGILVNTVYSDLYAYEGFVVLAAAVCYSLQIYFDFAGCTYMALGTGRMLGLSLPENFRQPYLAVSVEDFWRRWHLSLTSWLRSYVYIPLGGNRKGTLRKYFNVMVVFLTSGLWHGAGASFIIWGGLNGIFQIAGTMLRPIKSKIYTFLRMPEDSSLCIWWKRLWTFGWMTIAWVFFRSSGLSQALLVFKKIFSRWNPWVLADGTMYKLGLSQRNVYLLIGCLLIMLAVDLLHERKISLTTWVDVQPYLAKCLIVYVLIFAILIFGIYGSAYNASDFIYLQF
ncbi:MAG: MBOAT family protein [Oscillospiraceae bacterium]|nr:MBOAT family protein [Oscillospiraceae bacterium]